MSTEQLVTTIKDYILAEFLPGEDPSTLTTSTPLITGGILDSIATIKLVTHLEQTYGVEFEAHEMGKDHLDSVESIAGMVDRKMNEG